MGKNRQAITYNEVGLFLTDSPACTPTTSNIYYFNRVQSANFAIDVNRQDIQQIGGEDYLDRKIVVGANVSLGFDYLLTDGNEERRLGFNIASSGEAMPTQTIYHNLREDKSAFLVVGQEPFDLTGYANKPNGYSGTDAIGIGNCFINSYNIKAGVGSFATASVQMVASDIRYSCVGSGAGGHSWIDSVRDLGYVLLELGGFAELEDGGLVELSSPRGFLYKAGVPVPSLCLAAGGTAVGSSRTITYETAGGETETITNPGTGFEFNPIHYKAPISAIPPGGITMKISNLNVGGPIISGASEGTCIKGGANIQDFSISLPFARQNLRGFGSMHVYGRKIKYPQMGQLSFSLLSSAFESGKFSDIFCDDAIYNIEIGLNNACDFSCLPTAEHDNYMKFVINNAKLQGYGFTQDIGAIAKVQCQFDFGVSRNKGFFMSGSYT